MNCPTCAGRMKEFGSLSNYWCKRCGTIVNPSGNVVGVPTLVDCCQRFATLHTIDRGDIPEWQTFGIAEAINLPEERRSQ